MSIADIKRITENFIENSVSKDELESLLLILVKEGSLDSLELVCNLSECDYDGFTYNRELKYISSLTTLNWGKVGVRGVENLAISKVRLRI